MQTKFIWLSSLALALVASASAQSYSTGFENMTNGSVDGQDGWQSTNPNQVQSVVDNVSHSGNKSWLRSSAFGQGTFGDQPQSASVGVFVGESGSTGFSGYNSITSSIWFRAADTTGADGTTLGYSLTDTNGARMWSVTMQNTDAGSLGLTAFDVDPLTGPGTANFVGHSLGSSIDRSIWHNLTVNTTFLDGESNDTVQYFLDGNLVGTYGTWEQYYRYDPEQAGNGNQLFGVDRMMFRSSSNAGGQGFYFDDLAMNAVPEPCSMAVLGLGALALVRRRRNRKA
jgi:hypothetical protein